MFWDTVAIIVLGFGAHTWQILPAISQAISEEVNLHCLKIVSNITLTCGRNELQFTTTGFSWKRHCLERTLPQSERYGVISCRESSCVCDNISSSVCITLYRCLSNQPEDEQRVEIVMRNHASCTSSQSEVHDEFTRIGCGENWKWRFRTVYSINNIALKNNTDYESVNEPSLNTDSTENFTCLPLDRNLNVDEWCPSSEKPPVDPGTGDGVWKIVAIVMIVFTVVSLLGITCFCCRQCSQGTVSVSSAVSPVAAKVGRSTTAVKQQSTSNLEGCSDLEGYACLNNKDIQERASGAYTALVKQNNHAFTKTKLEPSRRNFASTSANYSNLGTKTTRVTQNSQYTESKSVPHKPAEPAHRRNGRPGRQSAMESSGTYEDVDNDPPVESRPPTYLDIDESGEFSYDYTDDQTIAPDDRSLGHLYDSSEYANDNICRRV